MKKKLKKIAIIIGILFAALITLFTLWSTWENWSGAREWKNVRAMLESENVELELAELLPEPVRPEDNFCATPLIASLTDFEWQRPSSLEDIAENSGEVVYANPELRERFLAIKLPDPEPKQPRPLPSWQNGSPANFAAVSELLNVDSGTDADVGVLEWMTQFEPELAELDAAAKRPQAQLPVGFSDSFIDNVSTPMPYLNQLMDLQKFQALRACASLHAGDRQQARAALLGMFQLGEASGSHPTLIGFLVALTNIELTLSVIWNGIDAALWSADDLRWIEEQLSQQAFLDKLERALVFEMITMQIGAPDFLKSISLGDSRHLVSSMGPLGRESTPSTMAGFATLAIPTGIWDHNKAFGCRLAFEHGILPVRERRIPDSDALVSEINKRSPRKFLASITMPATTSVTEKGIHTAVAIDLARLACAVERFKMENGDYPDTLDQLVPAFVEEIPMDLLAPDQPLRYGKGLHGDRYRIYSVGKNGTVDGGAVVFRDKSRIPPKRDLDAGDWAWGYAFE